MKKLLFILLFIPLILFSQETKVKNVLNYDTFKEEFLKVTDGITYYNGEPYTGVFYGNYENGQLKQKSNYKDGKFDAKSNYKDGKLDGLFQFFYKNGQLLRQVYYKEGKKDGLYESYYENGRLKIKTYYKDGKEDGLLEEYYENGQLLSRINKKNGRYDGLYEVYNIKGKLTKKYNFKDGREDGLSEFYDVRSSLVYKSKHKNGTLVQNAYYKNDTLVAYLYGVFKFYYDNNKIAKIETYKDGEQDGLHEEYYKNGQLKQKSNYKDGKLDGLFESYYDSGQLEYQKNYKDGKLDGYWSFIYGLGQVGIQTFYKDDEIYGMRYQYSFNGQLLRKNHIDSDGKWTNLRHIIKHTNIKNVNVYDLEAMIKVFLGDCEENNIKLLKDYKITSTFETLDKGKVALSYGIFNDKEIIIKVSPQEWSKASNPKRWYILYHELGHDVLNLKHGQGGKMMFNFTEEDYTWDDFFKDKFYMLNSIKRE